VSEHLRKQIRRVIKRAADESFRRLSRRNWSPSEALNHGCAFSAADRFAGATGTVQVQQESAIIVVPRQIREPASALMPTLVRMRSH
jgi:hypothetical protein